VNIVRRYAGGGKHLKEMSAHTQGGPSHAFDGQPHGVAAGIERAVFAHGGAVLELQYVVAVVQGVDVFGFAGF
jgi:hypothetical protein